MVVRDSAGVPLEEGNQVLIPIGNSFMPAQVVKVDSGIGSNLAAAPGAPVPQAVPVVYIQLVVARQVVTQDGRIADCVKYPPTQEKEKESVLSN